MSSNQAAWLKGNGVTLVIEPALLSDPKPNQILIKNHAVAINPVDWAMQVKGEHFPFLEYPCILGCDVAGEVVKIGSAVSRKVKVGDRVMGLASGPTKARGTAAFQEYTLLKDNLFSQIPDAISFEEASVIPLGLSTSASGMFDKDFLSLPLPSTDPKPLGKTLLVWSGASSVGCNAIQLGIAAGCDVITTCSPKNNELVKRLGASQAFDYNSDTIVSDILAYLEDKTIAGAICIGNVSPTSGGHSTTTATTVLEIVSKAKGKKFVAMAIIYKGAVPDGVETKFILGSSLADNEIGAAVYADYLPKALAEGKFVAAPEPMVVGKGLDKIEKAFEVQKKGVSARKVVVSL